MGDYIQESYTCLECGDDLEQYEASYQCTGCGQRFQDSCEHCGQPFNAVIVLVRTEDGDEHGYAEEEDTSLGLCSTCWDNV
jgi:DNA-directed RNA polymerase subunit RPC12/RpoP